jgi:MFS family permease
MSTASSAISSMGPSNDVPVSNDMPVRAVAAATIGTALEWFDFALYGVVSATVFPQLFFPSLDPTSGLLASLATFGVGLAARPLGAVMCGYLGDKFGRRNLLLITVSLMGVSSVLMGLLPTYQQVGVWAPILLVVLRIVQGFALGGESTGAQLMAVEHAHRDRRGKYSGLLGICSPISQILANGATLLLSSQLSAADFLSYGWRIPFLLSFILVVVGIYIRMRVSETPSFIELQHSKVVEVGSPLRDAVKLHYKDIVRLMLFFCGPTALFYLVVVFALGYITGTLGVPKQTAFALLMGANVCAILGALAGGMLSDRIGRKKALVLGSCATLIMIFLLFPMLGTKSFVPMLVAMGLLLGFTQYQSGIQPVYFAEAFPTNVRYSGSALSYTAANLLAGATLPALAVWLLRTFEGSPWSIVAIVAFWNIVSLTMILIGPETRGNDLNRIDSVQMVAH